MNKPIFTQADLKDIQDARDPSDFITADIRDWLLLLKRDRTDLSPAFTVNALIVARPQSEVEDGEYAVANVNGEHVLRCAPVTDGVVTGLVLGRLVEMPDAD